MSSFALLLRVANLKSILCSQLSVVRPKAKMLNRSGLPNLDQLSSLSHLSARRTAF